MFSRQCRRRVLSPMTISGISSTDSTQISTPLAAAAGENSVATSSTSLIGSKGSECTSILPASILEKSRMSLMIARSATADEEIVEVMERCSGFSVPCSKSSDMAMMPFIGVRISWLMFARKADLMRSASSARLRAWSRPAAVFFSCTQ